MQSSSIPVKFVEPFGANANPSTITYPVPLASQPGGRASLNDGFPLATMTPGGYPFGQDANGILFQTSAWNWWFCAGAPVAYDGTFSTAVGGYPKGALVASSTAFGYDWLSGADNNTANPDTGGFGWLGIIQAPLIGTDVSTGANSPHIIISVALPPAIGLSALYGQRIVVRKNALTITGPCNLTITDNLGNSYTASLVGMQGGALQPNDLIASSIFTCVFGGSNFRLQHAVPSELNYVVLDSYVNGNLFAADPTGDAVDSGINATVAKRICNAWAIFSDGGIIAGQNVANFSKLSGNGRYQMTVIGAFNNLMALCSGTSVSAPNNPVAVAMVGPPASGTNPSVEIDLFGFTDAYVNAQYVTAIFVGN